MSDQQNKLINRPPRIQPDLPQEEVEIPPPPVEDRQGQPLIQTFLPLITIIGYVIVSSTGQRSNLLLVLPMALSVIASSGLAVWMYFRDARMMKEKRDSYKQRLTQLRKDMESAHDMQRNFYLYNYPNIETVLQIAQNSGTPDAKDNRSGTRLWERRTSDRDFGVVRLGLGALPSSVVYTLQMGENNEDPLMDEAQKLAEDSHFVQDVPITIPLRPQRRGKEADKDNVIPARHSIGICGSIGATDKTKTEKQIYEFVRGMLTHFTAFHAPTDTRVYIYAPPKAATQWQWARWLPHCTSGKRDEQDNILRGDQLYFQPQTPAPFWEMIKADLDRRLVRMADKDSGDVTLPFLLVVVDALTLDDPNSPMKDIQSEEAVSLIIRRGAELGVSILFLTPNASHVPSQAETIIEVDTLVEVDGSRVTETGVLFRYAEVGLNSTRYIGQADTIDETTAQHGFARKLEPLSVRSTFGTAGLASSILLMDLHKNLGGIDAMANPLLERWAWSQHKDNSEWMRVPIGLMPGNKIREITFSAAGDGVHGMIAGTTGSGKSELLITLILGLAMRYDPSAVNFVLVDFKGGTAFKMFEKLPHVVNIVTNLSGTAGARTFVAMKSEMNRRSALLASKKVSHIVDYRAKGYHLGYENGNQPFPFLFVIIDEFAEMVKEMPEFKGELDSITRLGRALGVHLILATQRPSGAVTDQMRANIKFKLCLRVETAEDSRELLRASDAAFLPTDVPGRAYLQIGNDSSQLMQVAYASSPYNFVAQVTSKAKVIWRDRRREKRKKTKSADERNIADMVVEVCSALALAHPDVVKKQEQPWPDPLPTLLPLNAKVITPAMMVRKSTGDDMMEKLQAEEEGKDDTPTILGGQAENQQLPLSPMLIEWINERNYWAPIDWDNPKTLRAKVGLIDNPYEARQMPLFIDLKKGNTLLFGASGKGKSTFLRTLITALTVEHAPDELQIYALDFGGRGLELLKGLPHVGAVITSAEGERVERLLRKLRFWANSRAQLFAEAGGFVEYNATKPDTYPAILVVIDSFAEFRENYEDLLPDLLSLMRDGRNSGIYFVVTAEQVNAIPGKLFSLFNDRMTLKLTEAGDYSSVVGRVAVDLDDIAGRGFAMVERRVLEFQFADPIDFTPPTEDGAEADSNAGILWLFDKMTKAWGEGRRPEPIEVLQDILPLEDVINTYKKSRRIETLLGVEMAELQHVVVDLQKQGPHFIVIGQPFSGKTTALRSWILGMGAMYSPSDIRMFVIDSAKRLFDYGGKHTLADLPHVDYAISEQNKDEMTTMMAHIQKIYSQPGKKPDIYVIIDNYDDFRDLANNQQQTDIADMSRKYGAEGLHFVIACLPGSMSDDLRKNIGKSRYGLALDPNTATNTPFNARIPRKLQEAELPVGRAFLILSGRVNILQVATPYPVVDTGAMGEPLDVEEQIIGMMDEWVSEIRTTWADAPSWQLPSLSEEDMKVTPSSSSNGSSSSNASNPISPPVVVVQAPIELRFGEALMERIKGLISKDYSEMYASDEATLKTAIQDLDNMAEMALIAQAVGSYDLLPVLEELNIDPKVIAQALIENDFPPQRLARKLKVNIDDLKKTTTTEGEQ
ncbi:MAG: FtsK/SpoIIIE domain-containing protein [bacterium]|nr:FtsK/SpoIIIE domain-containing protein [bacterium]